MLISFLKICPKSEPLLLASTSLKKDRQFDLRLSRHGRKNGKHHALVVHVDRFQLNGQDFVASFSRVKHDPCGLFGDASKL